MIVTKGYIEVWRGGAFVSRHTVETKAIESALAHADEAGDGDYELRFPRKILSRITKTVVPFIWQTQPALSFTQGVTKTVQLRGNYLFDPQQRVRTVVVASGSLPAGCAINGTSVVYDGVGAAGTASFTLTASDGIYSQTSSSGSAEIVAVATNSPPVWTIPEDYTLPAFTSAGGTYSLDQHAFDAEGDAMVFSRTGGTAPGSMTISPDGVLTVPAGLADGIYELLAFVGSDADADWQTRSTATGVLWAHDFRENWEVDYFRWRTGSGHDPTGTYNPGGTAMTGASVRRLASDGITGSCLEIAQDVGYSTNWMWYRPFSPVRYAGALNTTGIADDPGYASGMHATDPYAASGTPAANWTWGYVAHPSVASTLGTNDSEARWARSELYVQFGVKISAGHTAAGGNTNPKLFYFDELGGDMGDECVGHFHRRSDAVSRFSLYTNGGTLGDGSSATLKVPMGSRTAFEPDVAAASELYQTDDYATCNSAAWTASNIASLCWVPPLDEWFTMMFRIVPGPQPATIAVPDGNNVDGVPYSTFDANGDGFLNPREQYYAKYPQTWTMLEMWVYQSGWGGFRKVFSSNNLFFNWTNDAGWNALKFTLYSEGVLAVAPQYHRFCQVICSTAPIAAPSY